MRPAGLVLAALLAAATAAGQPPAAPPGQPPAPAAPPPGKLDEHLAAWEKRMGEVSNFWLSLKLKRTDALLKQEKTYTGLVLCMKPNLARLRLANDADKEGRDYEAYVCNGKAVYEYSGLRRTVTEWPLPDPKAGATDNLMIDFVSGLKAKDAKERFDLKLFKEDAHYVYLDVLPKTAKDKQEFQQLRMALFGPNTKFAYLPAQVNLVKPTGDAESWSFSDPPPQTNVPGITPKHFEYEPVPGFTLVKGQPPASGPRPGEPKLPAGAGLPPGGAVRPAAKP
ncbi:MAG: TIGR03009 domain-containing protein [Isosphaera sp.]|nr:TIGR03009 domain-containing protein [Isosphaera sp.]